MSEELPDDRGWIKRHPVAFTLIILLIVGMLGCGGLIWGLVIMSQSFVEVLEEAKESVTATQCAFLEDTILAASEEEIKLGDPSTVLDNLVNEEYLQADNLNDVWGAKYVVTLIDGKYEVHSMGPDRIDGTEDDIYSE